MKYKILTLFLFSLLSSATAQLTGLELLEGQDQKKIKFNFVRGFLLMEVRYANFFPLKFIYDTGAQNTIIFDKITAELGPIRYDRIIQVTGADLSDQIAARIARGLTFKLNETPPVKRDVIVLEEDFIQMGEIIGEQVHGILGADFFKGLLVEINYKKQYLQIFDPRKFNWKSLKKHTLLETVFSDGKPYVMGTVSTGQGDSAKIRLLVDTGASISLLLHNDTHPSLHLPPGAIRGNLGKGLSGNLTGYVGRIPGFYLSGFEFPQVISYFQEYNTSLLRDSIAVKRNGIIGNFLLDRFNVVIDYVNEAMYLKAEKKYNRNFKYDRSGLVILAHGADFRDFVVNDVIEGSPADLAGVKADDVITKIGFTGRRTLTLDKINSKLSGKVGKKIKFKVKREGKNMEFEFRLADLL
ncbi:MAG: aspartyl protease family protein [Saprospiraceae bacterium]|nr:aspartyl protease family protein [Saprospiraceae bacterium]